MKFNSQSNQCHKMKFKKNQLEKKHRKPYELINQTHDPTYKAKITL